jgi:acetoin utilization deacetylase AcuC-like enzyme
MLRTALISDRRFLKHFAGRSHPERPERAAVMIARAEQLHRAGILALSPREATTAELELCHDPAYVAEVRRSASMPRYDFDPDTHTSPDSYQTALLAAGGVLTAVEAVMDGAADNAFAIVRPPGHHALATRAMGFCLFNNVAIAARYAQKKHGAERIAIIDFDVHHGNGSQDIFWDDDTVMYCSTHQMPLYPGTGAVSERGSKNTIVNAPLRPGDGGDQFRDAMQTTILPRLETFGPDLLIISAGFDAHMRDPLANLNFVEADFTWATQKLMDLADRRADGRVVSVLEGGYDLEGLSKSVAAHVTALMRG